MVCATRGIQSRVFPVAKVSPHPCRNIVLLASAGLVCDRARKRLQVEAVNLFLRGRNAVSVGGDAVVACLVVVVAHVDRDLYKGTLLCTGYVVGEYNFIVWDRVEGRDGAERAGAPGRLDRSSGLFDVFPVCILDAFKVLVLFAAAELFGDGLEVGLGNALFVDGEAKGVARGGNDAVDDGVLSIGVGPVVDGHAAGRLARDGNLLRVTAKGADVVADPFDGSALVAEAGVLGDAWVAGETKDVEAVVDGDEDGVLGLGKVLTIIKGAVCVANCEA